MVQELVENMVVEMVEEMEVEMVVQEIMEEMVVEKDGSSKESRHHHMTYGKWRHIAFPSKLQL